MRPSPVRASALLSLSGAVAVVLAAGCVPLPGGHSLTRRVVAGKQPENTLVAQDGSTCRVRGDEYDRAQVGDERRCAWKDVGVDGSGRGTPSPRPEPRRLPGRPVPR